MILGLITLLAAYSGDKVEDIKPLLESDTQKAKEILTYIQKNPKWRGVLAVPSLKKNFNPNIIKGQENLFDIGKHHYDEYRVNLYFNLPINSKDTRALGTYILKDDSRIVQKAGKFSFYVGRCGSQDVFYLELSADQSNNQISSPYMKENLRFNCKNFKHFPIIIDGKLDMIGSEKAPKMSHRPVTPAKISLEPLESPANSNYSKV